MTTIIPFSPTSDQNASFIATFDGQQYSVVVTWNLFGQRWVVNVYTLQGVLVLQKPLRGSPPNSDINLVEGYFSASSLVYRTASNTFEINP